MPIRFEPSWRQIRRLSDERPEDSAPLPAHCPACRGEILLRLEQIYNGSIVKCDHCGGYFSIEV